MKNVNAVVLTLLFSAFAFLQLDELPSLQPNLMSASIPSAIQFGLVVVTPEVKATSTGKLLFVGDILLARDVEQKILDNSEAYPYERISDFLNRHEFVVANFEAAIPKVHTPTPPLTFSFSVDIARIPVLKAAGISHVTLANNHSFDKGKSGFENSVQSLTEAGIVTLGGWTIASTSVQYVLLGKHRVAILAIDMTTNEFDHNAYTELFEIVQPQSDLQIVSIHWGEEYKVKHNKKQRTTAHWLVDNGADLIIGHHPHVVQDFEVYNGVPIAYSLGNFIFDQYFDESVQTGLVVTLDGTDVPYIELNGVTSIDRKASPRLLNQSEATAFFQNIVDVSGAESGSYITNRTMTLPTGLAN